MNVRLFAIILLSIAGMVIALTMILGLVGLVFDYQNSYLRVFSGIGLILCIAAVAGILIKSFGDKLKRKS